MPTIKGYYKSYFDVIDYPDLKFLPDSVDQSPEGTVNNRLRFVVDFRANGWLAATAAYDLSPRIKTANPAYALAQSGGLRSPDYRISDPDRLIYPQSPDTADGGFAIYQNLDRALLSVKLRYGDIYLGRQAIAWGSARVINPTDIIAVFSFDELDIEDRPGVDAIRVISPLGLLGEIDAGYVFGHDFKFDESAMFLRGRFNFRRNDLSLAAVGFRQNLLLGIDWTRPIRDAGFWMESAYVLAGFFDNDKRNSSDDYFRTSIGLDYSLKDGTYLFIEYHYNQAGTNNPDKYLALFDKTAYRDGAVFLLGKQYLTPGISRQITPLITATGQVLINLTDPSAFFMPQLEYNIAENIYLSAGAYFGLGQGPTYISLFGNDIIPFPRSEFGTYPDFYFTSFRIYY